MQKSKDELGLVLRALQFAARRHADQCRKDRKARPYISHPIALAEVLHTDCGVRDPVVIAAAKASGLTIGRTPREVWRVLRLDDHGNRFVVGEYASDQEARRMVDQFTARGHKQAYWVERVGDDEQGDER